MFVVDPSIAQNVQCHPPIFFMFSNLFKPHNILVPQYCYPYLTNGKLRHRDVKPLAGGHKAERDRTGI